MTLTRAGGLWAALAAAVALGALHLLAPAIRRRLPVPTHAATSSVAASPPRTCSSICCRASRRATRRWPTSWRRRSGPPRPADSCCSSSRWSASSRSTPWNVSPTARSSAGKSPPGWSSGSSSASSPCTAA
ncbi:hypothetical protein V2I01_25760 [Micromonospora sp. BRA006-A]|nr:hypothetical protein [Micromonospora sp. BRA006-A]